MTYPKVTEIRRQEWEPEQIAPNESVRKAHEVQQERIESWRAHSIEYPQNPTVCPKR